MISDEIMQNKHSCTVQIPKVSKQPPPATMAPAMKAMKAMKARAMKSSGVMTQTQVYSSIAETNGLKAKQAKGVVEALMAVCCSAEFPFFLQVLVPHRQIASPSGATSDSSVW